ncbi:hypothetical protein V1477_012859 [Vespula maculifrons]|uniref:Uncharacterized protein n=1 Tax=Vespula maculifrons TaxID=7453 RepID=A0ABD2BUH5_VESMC
MLACTRARDGNAARAHRCQKASRAWKPFTNKADVALQEAGRTESSMKRRLPAGGNYARRYPTCTISTPENEYQALTHIVLWTKRAARWSLHEKETGNPTYSIVLRITEWVEEGEGKGTGATNIYRGHRREIYARFSRYVVLSYEIEGTRDGSTPIDEIALSREINEISDF